MGEAACALLHESMSLQEVVQASLLRNPEIQMAFEEVGIAQADWVNASLIANPVADVMARLPSVPAPGIDLEIDALQPFVSLLLQPLRKKTASIALEAMKARVTGELFCLIERIGESYYRYLNAKENLALHNDVVEARFLASDVGEKQYAAGNINLLMRDRLHAAYRETLLAHKMREIEATLAKEELAKWLGSPCEPWEIEGNASFVPLERVGLEAFALERRFDLQALWLETNRHAVSFGLYKWWAYTDLGAGISYESDPQGGYNFGPGFGFAIPIFNFGQGDRMRVSAEFALSYQTYLAKRLEIMQEVASCAEGYAKSLEQLALIEEEILPLKTEMIDEQVRLYNFMNSGVFEILDAKVDELVSQMEKNDAYCRAGVYLIRLEKALGGGLP